MKFRLICTFGFLAAGAGAQVTNIAITPHAAPGSNPTDKLSSTPAAKRVPAAGAAVVGYVMGSGPAEVHPIFGTAKRPLLGGPAVVPAGAQRLYLPPRQQYVLVEESADEPVGVWTLHRAIALNETPETIAVKGAMAHPDLVAFSPRGDAALLYSQATASVQVLTHMPGEPSLTREISMAGQGTAWQFAITDDGALVVAGVADHSLAFSQDGKSWQPLTTGLTPQAWTFISNTHDFAISDTVQKTIMLVSNLGDAARVFRVLSQGVAADGLAVTKNGDRLIAGNVKAGQVWTIDLKTGTLTPQEGIAKLDSLSSLRDGFTFLLSASPSVSLLRLTALPDSADSAASSGTVVWTQDAKGGR